MAFGVARCLRLALPCCATLALTLAWPALAQAQVVQDCAPAQFVDRTAPDAVRRIVWDFSVLDAPERCMRVRTGQTVVWQGDLDDHPLGQQGGNTPNPIGAHVNGSVTFNTPGTFGYKCLSHSSMIGAIQVVAPSAVPGVTPAQTAALASILLTLGLVLIRSQQKQRWPAGI